MYKQVVNTSSDLDNVLLYTLVRFSLLSYFEED